MFLLYCAVFFNLLSEAERFTAILIAHGTHVFFGGLLKPEGSKFKVKVLKVLKAESGDFLGPARGLQEAL